MFAAQLEESKNVAFCCSILQTNVFTGNTGIMYSLCPFHVHLSDPTLHHIAQHPVLIRRFTPLPL
jgi:hypothetical protein